jgi:hypothetical protein
MLRLPHIGLPYPRHGPTWGQLRTVGRYGLRAGDIPDQLAMAYLLAGRGRGLGALAALRNSQRPLPGRLDAILGRRPGHQPIPMPGGWSPEARRMIEAAKRLKAGKGRTGPLPRPQALPHPSHLLPALGVPHVWGLGRLPTPYPRRPAVRPGMRPNRTRIW